MKYSSNLNSIGIIFFLACVGGCANSPSLSQREFITIPPLGQEAEAEVGQTIISTALLTRTPVIRVTQEISEPEATIPAGEYPLSTKEGGRELYEVYPEKNYGSYGLVGLAIAAASKESTGAKGIVSLSRSPNDLRVYAANGSLVGASNIAIKIVRANRESSEAGSFKRELIYTGVTGSTINLLYREFLNDLARPAFSQELKYDLAQGSTIGYKGARFQIIKATNTSITYKAISAIE
jgi:hypothetical protein